MVAPIHILRFFLFLDFFWVSASSCQGDLNRSSSEIKKLLHNVEMGIGAYSHSIVLPLDDTPT